MIGSLAKQTVVASVKNVFLFEFEAWDSQKIPLQKIENFEKFNKDLSNQSSPKKINNNIFTFGNEVYTGPSCHKHMVFNSYMYALCVPDLSICLYCYLKF